MKLEYIVKCDFYGTGKSYNKVFYTEQEYNNFKNWIESKRGYTNVKFFKKKIQSTDSVKLEVQKNNLNKKEYLKKYLIANKKEVSFFKFIYCLISEDEVVYVGKTISIQSRIFNHKKEGLKKFDSFAIVAQLPNEISASELLKIEEKYIKLLKPKYNIVHNENTNTQIISY